MVQVILPLVLVLLEKLVVKQLLHSLVILTPLLLHQPLRVAQLVVTTSMLVAPLLAQRSPQQVDIS